MTASNPIDLVRPLLWLATFAFLVGFCAYLLLGAGSLARTSPELREPPARAVSAATALLEA